MTPLESSDPVSEEEARDFHLLIRGAIKIWLDEHDRRELPDDLARKTLEKMAEVSE